MTPEATSEVQRRNVGLVARISEIDEAGGMRALYEHFDEICQPEFHWSPRMIGFGKEAYVGRDGFLQYVDDMEATMEEVDLTVAETRPVGDQHVLLVGRLRLVGKGSHVPLDSEWAILFRLSGGLAQSGVAFNSHAEAEEAASNATA